MSLVPAPARSRRRRPLGRAMVAAGVAAVVVAGAVAPAAAEPATGTIAGTVTTPAGVSPTFVTVLVLDPDGGGAGGGSAPVGTDGTYRVEDVPAGDWALLFATGDSDLIPEYFDDAALLATSTTVAVAGGGTATADATLELGGVIEGTVRDGAGNPVAGAFVNASRSDWSSGGAYDTTDDEGRYHLGGLRSGGYRILANPLGGSSLLLGWVGGGTSQQTAAVIAAQQGVTVVGQDAVLPTAGMAAGRLRSATGAVVGGTVQFTSVTDAGNVVTVTTGADGEFEGRMAPGQYRIRFSGPADSALAPQYWGGTADVSGSVAISVGAGATFPLGDVVLASGGSITGTVTDDDGEPVAGVTVTARSGLVQRTGVTGADGSYTVAGLATGAYTVSFTPPAGSVLRAEHYDDAAASWEADVVAVTTGATTTGIDAELAVGGGIEGRVLAPGGAPLAGASVHVWPRDPGTGSAPTPATTGADGTYHVGGLAAGAWVVEVVPPFGSTLARVFYLDATTSTAATAVDVTVRETEQLEDVVLEPGASVSGVVLDPDGAPVAGAWVGAQRAGASTALSAQTGADGSYTIIGLPAGGYRVRVSPPWTSTDLVAVYHPGVAAYEQAQEVTVAVGASRTLPATRLLRAGVVSGTITRPDGTPVAGASVNAYSGTQGGSATTAADGTYTIGRLSADDFRVSVSSSATMLGTYDGVTTYHDGRTGTQRRSLATTVSVVAGQTSGEVDLVVPPRGQTAPDVTVTLDPATPRIGRPVTATVQVDGPHGPAVGGVAQLSLGDDLGDVVLGADGRGVLTFDAFAPEYGLLFAWFTGTAAYDEGQGTVEFLAVEDTTPQVTVVAPAAGSSVGGTVVTVTGSGFTPSSTVTFGGVPAASVVVDSATSLRATTPTLPAGPAPVVVTTAGGASAADVAFTATPEPTTTVLTLPARTVLEGAPVTVTATVSAAAGVPSGNVTFAVNDALTVVPVVAGVATLRLDGLAPGTYGVRAVYAGGGGYASSATWRYLDVIERVAPVVSQVTPAAVTAAGGQRVQVRGTHLTGATGVSFGGVPGSRVTVVDDGLLEVDVPAHPAGTVPVVVTTPAGSSAPSGAVQFVDTSAGVVSQVPVRIEDELHVGDQPRCLQVAGTTGVPAGASGVTLNVTVVAPYEVGYVTVYPDVAGPREATSTVNFEVGQEVANAAFVALPANGRVCYRPVGGIARVLLDVTGFTMPDSGTELQDPVRLLDTRPAPFRVGDVDGPVGPRSVHTVQVRGRAGVPADATAVIVNATVTNVTGPGNLRLFPAGAAVPNASVLNYAPGKDKANAAIVALSSSGRLSIFSDTDGASVDVVLDVTGYVTGDGAYRGVTPSRALDTRPGAGHVGDLTGPLPARTPSTFTLPSAAVPAGATSVVLNVTAIGPNGPGNLRVYPSGQSGVPYASTINYIPGRDIPNLVVVDLPDSGPATVTLYSDMEPGGTVHVAADVAGFVVP